MTDYIGVIEGRLATSDAVLRQVLSWLRDVRPETSGLFGHDDHGNYVDAWRHGATAALLAYHHGYDNVKRWGDAFEDYHPDNEQEFRQDVRNNEVGAKIGALARLTGMTVSELGDAVKAGFQAGVFQPDAYAPYSGSSTFRVGDKTLSVGSGVVTLPDGSRFDLTKSAIISVDGAEYPLLHVIRKDGSVQDNWTNMEDSRTLFQGGVGKWEAPQVATAPSLTSSMLSPAIAAQPVPFPDVASLAQRLTTEKYFRGHAPTPNGGPEGASALAPFESPRTGTSGPIPYLVSTKAAQQLFAKVPPLDFPAFPTWASPGGAIGPSNPQLLNGLPMLPLPQRRSAAPDDPAWDSAQGTSPAASAFQQDAAYSPAGDFVGNFPRVSASATMPSPVALNGSASSAGPRMAGDFHTLGQSIARILGGAGQFIGNALVSPAEAASPSGPLLRSATVPNAPSAPPIADPSAGAYFPASTGALGAETDGSAPSVANKDFRYLARIVADKPQASVFDTGAPAVPIVPDSPDFSGGLPSLPVRFLTRVDPRNPGQGCAPAANGQTNWNRQRRADARLALSATDL